ncbi:D-alanyl-D-alanine carboxypeptidase family protein [Alloiococcus otitis]|uniref:D-alanyl-D-alanine carboxypeptidase family protein n=1 Tax=Alloiococcus otitis TaxID=1652 RepID=UPI0023579BDB|nr:D-alanyl-D-alanine carboxypeptidase family protein [Alloiococcus otitis]
MPGQKIKKSILTGILALFIWLPNKAWAQEDIDVQADSALLLDASTQQVLYEDNIDEVKPIASLTKILVQYIVLEEIDQGNLNWQDQVSISPFLEELSQNFELANVPLFADQTYSASELFYALSVYSANAATMALAEHIEGSEEAFVYRMRDLVASFGIEDAHLVNTTGLHNSFLAGRHIPDSHEEDDNTMSARSMATIASRLLKDHPDILDYSSQSFYDFETGYGVFEVENRNKMLAGLSHEYPGVKGMKTGTTESSGRSFIGYYDGGNGERPLLALVFNAGDLEEEADRYKRFEETAKLFDHGRESWQVENLMDSPAWADQLEGLPVVDGQVDQLDLEVKDQESFEFMALQDKQSPYQLSLDFDPAFIDDEGLLQAPIEAGDQVGDLVFDLDPAVNYLNGRSKSQVSFPLYAKESVSRDNVLVQVLQDFIDWLKNIC